MVPQELVNPLNTQEQVELAECEEVIERGQRSFIEVGQALMRIRDSRLYRETHTSFETYCKERWQMVDRYANRLIAGAKVTEALSTGAHGPPSRERVARPLTELRDETGEVNSELVQEAWAKAEAIAQQVSQPHEEGPKWNRQTVVKPRPYGPTEADVRKAVRLVKGEEEAKPRPLGSKPKLTEAELHFEAALEELRWLVFNNQWDLVDRAYSFLGREIQKRAS